MLGSEITSPYRAFRLWLPMVAPFELGRHPRLYLYSQLSMLVRVRAGSGCNQDPLDHWNRGVVPQIWGLFACNLITFPRYSYARTTLCNPTDYITATINGLKWDRP